jgi:hypothetical protein
MSPKRVGHPVSADQQPDRHSAPARRETCADGPALTHAHVDSSDRCPSAPDLQSILIPAPDPSSSARRPSFDYSGTERICAVGD